MWKKFFHSPLLRQLWVYNHEMWWIGYVPGTLHASRFESLRALWFCCNAKMTATPPPSFEAGAAALVFVLQARLCYYFKTSKPQLEEVRYGKQEGSKLKIWAHHSLELNGMMLDDQMCYVECTLANQPVATMETVCSLWFCHNETMVATPPKCMNLVLQL